MPLLLISINIRLQTIESAMKNNWSLGNISKAVINYFWFIKKLIYTNLNAIINGDAKNNVSKITLRNVLGNEKRFVNWFNR